MQGAIRRLSVAALATLLAGCTVPPVVRPPPPKPIDAHDFIEQSLPKGVSDRDGWVADIYDGFSSLGIEPSREHVCAVVAVIEQESSFRVDPVVPGLGRIAWREIDRRAEHAGIPRVVVHEVLELKSPTGQSYSDRIDAARTEKQLSDIFEDFTGSLPLGRTLFASWNPIRTRGPMQVSVAFAEKFAATRAYPYPVKISVADEAFTRRGSLYFGIAHLLAYPAPYDRYLYRFADYNAGQYSSRNAAFQVALGIASGIALVPDGALLPRDAGPDNPGATELAARALGSRFDLSDSTIHGALEQARTEGFENSPLYKRVFSLARATTGRASPPARVPRIQLQGPKIVSNLTTDWYAHRVDDRFSRCLAR
jgi:hypothetical protein